MKRGDTVETERLIIRNWDRKSDANAMFELNSSPKVMRFYPTRSTQQEPDELFDKIDQQFDECGYSWSAVVLKATDEIIGFGGLARISSHFPNGPTTEIGWRLLPHSWGNGYATEMGRAMLDYGFEKLNRPEIVSFAVLKNTASFAVMERIGMKRQRSCDFDHPDIDPNIHPSLVRHGVYKLTADQWHKQKRLE